MILKNTLATLGLAALCGSQLATALPLDELYTSFNASHPFASYSHTRGIQPRQNKVELRILPLGASIMSGVGSPEHSGLRKWLRMALRYDGWDVNMVGTKQDGTDMVDNDHEATPGFLLHQIREALQLSLGYRPNIVIINGGTNNANGNFEVDKAYEYMEGIANDIWATDGMADTCVIVSTLLPTTNSVGAQQRIPMNGAYRKLVADYRDRKCIYLADMEPAGDGASFLSLDQDLYADNPKVHPNNEGHKRMAYVFYAAIQRALVAGKVIEAAPKTAEPNTGCRKEFGNGIFAGGLTQRGSGYEDGIYYHNAQEMGVTLTIESSWDRNQWRFARLFSRDYDDLVGWFEYSSTEHRFGVWKNSADGRGSFTKINDLIGDMYCIPRGLHFIDMNADGLDDIVCIDPDGNAYLSINQGNGNGNNPPSFKRVSSDAKIFSSKGKQENVMLGDIDGDGRGDICIVDYDGNAHCYRNGGQNDIPEYWQDLGVRVNLGVGGDGGKIGPEAGYKAVRFEDVNGDGRDDYMYMRYTGETFTWTNSRSCLKGREGDGLNVAWRQGFHAGESSGATHYGMADYVDDNDEDFTLQRRIHFARIYGTKPAFGNYGVQDYVLMEHEKVSDDKHVFRVRPWKNIGSGGTKVKADGNKYCNMLGHVDGSEDYVWTWSTGAMLLYPNAGKKAIVGDESFWGPVVDPIWTPPGNMDRRDLHLEDWDNDGDCDIIWVNPDNGNIRVWINDYPTKQTWNGAWREIATPTLSCDQKRGIGIQDLAVRFADITGNGRADYLCLEKDGRTKGYVQRDDGSFETIPQIKFSEDKDRANLRWADVNGDGKDDMIWIEKFSGDGHVWYNGGRGDPGANSGSSFHWDGAGAAYAGTYAGTCQFFPDLDGNGRADLHSIKGTFTNEAETWFNPSCGLDDHFGDDANAGNPSLPVQPGNPSDGSPGPGEPGSNQPGSGDGPGECENLDDRYWRHVTCTDKYIDSAVGFYTTKERWDGIDVPGAWESTKEFWACWTSKAATPGSFSNTVSDFMDGPDSMLCETWSDANGCRGLALQCPSTVTGPAGSWILESWSRISDFQNDFYKAIESAVVFADIETIADDFGLYQKEGMPLALSIILDIVVTTFGIIGAPTWNKFILPKIPDRGNGGTLKDGINDIVKNGATLAKDIYNSKQVAADPLGLQTLVRTAMKNMADSWREGIVKAHSKLFDGSAESIFNLGAIMQDGIFLDPATIEQFDTDVLQRDIKHALYAAMIPLVWQLSPDKLWPVIIHEEVGCNDPPPKFNWLDDFDGVNWMSRDAYGKRVCADYTAGTSYWLVTPQDYSSKCDTKSGDLSCASWDAPPGFDKLEKADHFVTVRDVVEGSMNTWIANGRKNGAPAPELTTDFFDTIEAKGLVAPGMFNIPVCGMEEARANWESAYNGATPWKNFPCNA